MQVKEIMTRTVVTVGPTESIGKIAELVVENRVSGIPVVDVDGHGLGIVSEGDLIQKEVEPQLPDGLCILGAVIIYSGLREYRRAFRKLAALTAEEIMTPDVITVQETDDVSAVAKIMRDRQVKRVPVVDAQDKLIGIVSRYDIVKMLVEQPSES